MNAIRKIVNEAVLIQKKAIKQLLKEINSLWENYYFKFQNELDNEYDQSFENREKVLESLYGGKQEHIKSCKPYNRERVNNNEEIIKLTQSVSSIAIDEMNTIEKSISTMCFTDLNNNINSNHEMTKSNSTSNYSSIDLNNNVINVDNIANTNDLNYNEAINSSEKLICDDKCEIPLNWAIDLHIALSKLNPEKELHLLQNALIKFENCQQCEDDYINCENNETCSDKLRLLLKLMPHYQHIRTLVRRIYSINSSQFYFKKDKI